MSNNYHFVAIQFNKRSGKVIKTAMAAYTSALLKAWALANTPKTRQTVVFEVSNGKCILNVEGGDPYPTIIKETSELTCKDFGLTIDDLKELANGQDNS